MAEPLVQLRELELLSPNPDKYESQFFWRVRLECQQPLPAPINISFVWVGSASSSEHDQKLDDFDVGPLNSGVTEFDLECDAPVLELVPPSDVLGVTILFLSFQYNSQEFLRVGYYTQVAYFDGELNDYPPPQPVKDLLGRFVAMAQPAVTSTPIQW